MMKNLIYKNIIKNERKRKFIEKKYARENRKFIEIY